MNAGMQNAAKLIKEQMDRKYGKNWHCIIGEGFGFNVSYEMNNLLYLYYNGTLAVLVFKGTSCPIHSHDDDDDDDVADTCSPSCRRTHIPHTGAAGEDREVDV